jgi:hypothetical protein
LLAWTKKYLEVLGNRRHHLTFEYVMLHKVNDTEHHADVLADFVKQAGQVKVNLIPYNFTDSEFETTPRATLDAFMARLEDQGVIVTSRRTMGEDIAAACGQLIVKADANPRPSAWGFGLTRQEEYDSDCPSFFPQIPGGCIHAWRRTHPSSTRKLRRGILVPG